MRHTGMYVVELGVGIGKGGESCRRKKGKRIVEERRGRICEGSYPCRRLVCGKNIRLESMFHLGGGEL